VLNMRKPNIIFILTDDQAQWAAGVYGNKEIYTPNIDKLAEEGVLFTHAFSAPVCSPSRAMIMTGLYPNKVGIDDWISPDETEGLLPDKPTIAEILKKAGYFTGLIGKWHLGKEEIYHPLNRGFDYFMGFLDGGNTPRDPILEVDGKKKQVKGFTIDIVTQDAIRFIRENKDKPFALFLHTREPHTPYTPVPPEDMAHYVNKKLTTPDIENFPIEKLYLLDAIHYYATNKPQIPMIEDMSEDKLQDMFRGYYASISSIDRNVGYILAELDTLKLTDNTIVIFMSDNGYLLGHHGLVSKGNAAYIGTNIRRSNMFEHSIKVPLIIRWPEVTKRGTICNEIVCSLDFFPTFLEILKLTTEIELGENLELDGISIFPLLEGKSVRTREEIFLLYDMHHHNPYNWAEAHMRMLRTNTHKLVLHCEDERKNEFYSIDEDPEEEKNIYGKEATGEIQRKLASEISSYRKKIKDTVTHIQSSTCEECQ
jgi:uncharacterized sulfatase